MRVARAGLVLALIVAAWLLLHMGWSEPVNGAPRVRLGPPIPCEGE